VLLIETEATVLGSRAGYSAVFRLGSLRLLSMLPQTASIVSASMDTGILEALGISVVSGILAGAYPAWRGSHLSPVEAIRMTSPLLEVRNLCKSYDEGRIELSRRGPLHHSR